MSAELGQQKKEALRLTALMSGSTVLSKLVGFPLNVAAITILGPAAFGMVKICELVGTYTGINHLGLLQALTRQASMALGRGDQRQLHFIEDIVATANIVVMALTVLAFWLAYAAGTDFDFLTPYRVSLICIMVLSARLDNYLHNYNKAHGHFSLTTRHDIVIAWTSPFIFVGLVFFWHLDGALLALALRPVIGSTFYLFCAPVRRPHLRLSWRPLCHYTSIGFQIFSNKVADQIFWSIDSTIIALLLPLSDLGQYGFALTVILTAASFNNVFGMMAYRHMLLRRSQLGLENGLCFLKGYLLNPFAGFLVFASVFVILGNFICALTIRLFMPQYNDALMVLPLIAVGQIFFMVAKFPSLCLNVSDQMKLRLIVTLVCLALNAVLDVILIKMGLGILGAALASAISFSVFGAALVLIVFRQVWGSSLQGTVYLVKILPVTVAIGGLLTILNSTELVVYSNATSKYLQILLAGIDATIKSSVSITLLIGAYLCLFQKTGLAKETRQALAYIVTESKRLIPTVKSA